MLKCPNNGYGNPFTKLCTNVCPQSPFQTFGDNLTSTCVLKCPNNTYGNKFIDVCVKAINCPNNSKDFFGDDSTNLCVANCPFLKGTYGDQNLKKCVK